MRHLFSLLAVLVLAGSAAAASPVPPAPVAGTPVFVVTGGGWGHNVGLSQWGAYGQAKAGRPYDRILRHYFPGTKLAPTPVRTVRVLLAPAVRTIAVTSSAPFRVRDATGVVRPVDGLQVKLDRRLRVWVVLAPGGLGAPVRKRIALPSPVTFLPARGATLALDGKGLRGKLKVARVAKRLQAVMVVGLDAYVQGIVPGEMPKEWPLEALKAQAVAARTYAVANLVSGKPWDIVADPYAFAYYGATMEAPATTEAVRQTRGQVLLYGGRVITAFYFSSSGGRTLSAQDVFGLALPYLPGASDPWDELSPHHRWPARTFTPVSLARLIGAPDPVLDVHVVPSAPGRPLAFQLATKTGASIEVRAAELRTRLGLKSPNFQIGVLRLTPVPGAVPAGQPVTLSGMARDVGDTMLEERPAGGVWKPVRRVAVQGDGSFVVVLRPSATSAYRLTAAGLIGPSQTVTVAAQAGG